MLMGDLVMKENIEKFWKITKIFLQKNWWDIRYLLLLIIVIFFLRFDKFIKWITYNTGSVADWFSAIGTVAAIFFVYWQIDEQQSEFKESKVHNLKIAFWTQSHAEESSNGGIIVGGHDCCTWAVNDGLMAASFRFLGFCRVDKFKDIYNDDDVLLDPYAFDKKHLLPHSTADFELLQPGEVSKQHNFPADRILEELESPESFFVLYMDAADIYDVAHILFPPLF